MVAALGLHGVQLSGRGSFGVGSGPPFVAHHLQMVALLGLILYLKACLLSSLATDLVGSSSSLQKVQPLGGDSVEGGPEGSTKGVGLPCEQATCHMRSADACCSAAWSRRLLPQLGEEDQGSEWH